MTTIDALNLDSLRPAFTEDPYPLLAELRAATPVRRVELLGMPAWLVTRYDDVRALFGSPLLSSDARSRARQSLLGALVHVPEGEERLDDVELAPMGNLLMVAGYTTTPRLSG